MREGHFISLPDQLIRVTDRLSKALKCMVPQILFEVPSSLVDVSQGVSRQRLRLALAIINPEPVQDIAISRHESPYAEGDGSAGQPQRHLNYTNGVDCPVADVFDLRALPAPSEVQATGAIEND